VDDQPGANICFNSSGNQLFTVECSYDIDQFTDPSSISVFTQTFQQTTDSTTFNNSLNTILSSFCQRTETDSSFCPINAITNERLSSCSNFLSSRQNFTQTESAAELCRTTSFTSAPEGGVSPADNAKIDYCTQNPTAPDCLCLQPTAISSEAATFNAIAKRSGLNLRRVCFWRPCQFSQSFLVTDAIQTENCPSQVCDVINQFIDDNNDMFNLQNVRASQTCTQNNNNNTNNNNNGGNFFDNNAYFIIGTIVVILVVILVWILIKRNQK
jgi:hypothetical protein